MPFTACPNRELLFLSFMVEKMKISTHSKRDKAEKFPFYFFLYFALLNFGTSLEVRKKCVSMYRCIHLLINGFSKKILTPSQPSGGAANNKTIIRRAESTKAIGTGTEVCLESSSLELL